MARTVVLVTTLALADDDDPEAFAQLAADAVEGALPKREGEQRWAVTERDPHDASKRAVLGAAA